MTASGGVMRESALQPQSMVASVFDGGKSTGRRRFVVEKGTYYQGGKTIVSFVTVINEIFLSKAEIPDARKASKPQTAPRLKAG
jgi:hypothetical protein